MSPAPRGRFAPSPSGRMHLGNAFCALLAWLSVRAQGGRMVLRIEDLDPARCRAPYADLLMDDLAWLGLDWDEGPGAAQPRAPYYQSQRRELYEAALETLRAQGLVYPCFCSRAWLHAASAPHAADGLAVYDGRCRALTPAQAQACAAHEAHALRLRVPGETIGFVDGVQGAYAQHMATQCGDFVVRRADGVHAYQLAVVVDDLAMGVTQVARGRDLLASAPRQMLLCRLLGGATPEYYHLPLLLAPDGRRLSKRDHDLDLGALRKRRTSAEIVGFLAHVGGLIGEYRPVTPRELTADFCWQRVPTDDILLTDEALRRLLM